MSDITANVVVSMPSQLFTMARSFKAVTNGKIYIGKIDTDPVNPENQIQVYVENEDGSHVPVSQPIIINAAGYPVYNGQIAKFVTVQGHSMAVYDAYGAQQFYFPNVLKYDPDQLRSDLIGPYGMSLIGGATYKEIRNYTGSISSIYCIGRDNIFDCAHGWFDKIENKKLIDDDGVVLVANDGSIWLRRERNNINPLWFGADPYGKNDSSIAINKAIACANNKNNGREGLPPVLTIPGGTYTINGMVRVYDWSNGAIICDGAYFSGTGSDVLDAVFQIDNASNLKITGSLTITTNGLSNYKSAFDIKASPGGMIEPDTGIVSHVDIFGVTLRESFVGFSLGRVNSDVQIAEINFHGCETMFCAIPIHIKGSQTGASFNGCTISCGTWQTFPDSTKYRTLLMEGGICEISGGEFLNSAVPKTSLNLCGIEMNPCISSKYSNTFGALRINGALIELTSSLLIVGPGVIAGPYKSDTSFCSISNCGGYVDQVEGGNFIEVYEPSFAGTITVDESCNFYSLPTSRTGKNARSDSPMVKFNFGRTSFGTGFMDWMGGVSGGILKHSLLPVAAANTTTQAFTGGADNTIILENVIGTAGFARYDIYNQSTGMITVPNGCRNIAIEYMARGEYLSGTIRIRKNGNQTVVFGIISSGVVYVKLTESQPVAGDYYDIVLFPTLSGVGLSESRLMILAEF